MSAATGYSLSGPAAGAISVASKNFTVTLTPAGGTASDTVITPASTVAGTFTPATVTLNTAGPSATFTFTPTANGIATISSTNNNSLTDPGSVSYAVQPPDAACQHLAGDALTPTIGARLSLVPNTYAPLIHTIAHLPAPVASASLQIKISNQATAAVVTKAALVMDPGTVQSDGSYTAKVVFPLIESDTTSLIPGTTYALGAQATTTTSHTVDTAVADFVLALSGGPLG